jgi:putative sigma-54 modulation protein
MDLTVYFGNLTTVKTLHDDVSDLMRGSFERFQSYIRCVTVTFTDVNGPKGGIDKQCRCVVQLKRMAPIVIEDRDGSFVNLVTRVASRASQTLSQRIDRKQSSYRSRKRDQNQDAQIVDEQLVEDDVEGNGLIRDEVSSLPTTSAGGSL